MPQPTVLCDCGCGQHGIARKMRPVRRSIGSPRVRGRTLYRNAESYLVLPGCVRPFMRELRARERIRATTILLLRKARWRRLRTLPKLWNLRRAMLHRRLGHRRARQEATSFILGVLFAKRTE